MQWILILWIVAVPDSTGVVTQPDEGTCIRALSIWENISVIHEGLCVYGNLKELNLEHYKTD